MDAAKALAEADAWRRAEAEAQHLGSAHERIDEQSDQVASVAEPRKYKGVLDKDLRTRATARSGRTSPGASVQNAYVTAPTSTYPRSAKPAGKRTLAKAEESVAVFSLARLVRLTRILTELQKFSRDVEASALISSDGSMVSSALAPGMDESRVAEMTATLISFSTNAANELRRGNVSELIVRGSLGYAMVIDSGCGMLLLVLARENPSLDRLSLDIRGAAEEIKTAMSSGSESSPA